MPNVHVADLGDEGRNKIRSDVSQAIVRATAGERAERALAEIREDLLDAGVNLGPDVYASECRRLRDLNHSERVIQDRLQGYLDDHPKG